MIQQNDRQFNFVIKETKAENIKSLELKGSLKATGFFRSNAEFVKQFF